MQAHVQAHVQAYVYGSKRELPASFDAYGSPDRAVIVSIDMHRGHLDEGSPCPAPRARDIVAPIDAFHDRARALGVPIVHVRTVLREGGVDDVNGRPAAWRSVFPLHVGPIPNADEHAIEGTCWTELVTRVAPGDLMVSGKKRLSAFHPTDLDFLLRNLRAETLILNGGFTDCCVLNTAFEGSNLGYRIVVLRDLVRGTDEAMEAAALKMVSLHLGLVMDSDDLLGRWTEAGPDAARGQGRLRTVA